MNDENIQNIKESINTLVQAIYNSVKPIIEEIYNKLKDIVETLFIKKTDKRINRRINIYLRTKSYRIKKKQLKLIVRGMQVYFI